MAECNDLEEAKQTPHRHLEKVLEGVFAHACQLFILVFAVS